jgi:WD40 repeat protein
MADRLGEIIIACHEALEEEISILNQHRLHRSTSNAEYVSFQLGRKSRSFLNPRQTAKNDDTTCDALQKIGCDYGKLLDIKAVFDHYTLLTEPTPEVAEGAGGNSGGGGGGPSGRRKSSFALLAADMASSRVQSAPLTRKRKSVAGTIHAGSGMPETIFLDKIAPVLCPDYPRDVHAWYGMIDATGTGFVNWSKMSQYLLTLCEESSKQSKEADSLALSLQYKDIPESPGGPSPSYRVLRAIDGKRFFYVLCSDGHVRELSKVTSQVVDTIHYPDGTMPIDIKWCPERNQLFVGQPNGVVFCYNTTGHLSRQGNVIKAYKVGASGVSISTKYGMSQPVTGGSTAIVTIPKTVKFDPLHMELPSTGKRIVKTPATVVADIETTVLATTAVCRCLASVNASVPCTCTASVGHSHLSAIEPYMDDPSSKDPPFFAGFDTGHVALYRPPLIWGSITVMSTPWRKAAIILTPHRARITHLQYCDTFSDLRGLLSSSAEGHITLNDVESGETLMTFQDAPEIDSWREDGGGWIDGHRPVSRFDVSRQQPIIASYGHMRGVSLWSASLRTKLATFNDHRGAITSVCFNNDVNQLATIGEDRTVRIYDIRTLRSLQVIVDRERLDSTPYSEISYDHVHSRIVAWSGSPHFYTMVDDSVASPTAENLTPVTSLMAIEQLGNLLQVNSTSVVSRNSHDGEMGCVVKSPQTIVAVTRDPCGRRIFLAFDNSTIAYYSIGASNFARKIKIPCEIKSMAFIAQVATATGSMPTSSSSPMRSRSSSGANGGGGGGAVENPAEGQLDSDRSGIIVVGSAKGMLFLFADRTVGTTITPSTSINLNTCGDSFDNVGDVVVVLTVRPKGNQILCGTTNGLVVLASLERDGLVVRRTVKQLPFLCLATVAPIRTLIEPLTKGRERGAPSSAPARTGSARLLWQRAMSASRKEKTVLHAEHFTKFRYSIQEQTQIQIDSITVFDPIDVRSTAKAVPEGASCPFSYIAVGFANGDVKIFYTSVENSPNFECICAFPASSCEGCGFQLASTSNGTLWVGDDAGVVCEYSVNLDYKPPQEETPSPASNEHHRSSRVRASFVFGGEDELTQSVDTHSDLFGSFSVKEQHSHFVPRQSQNGKYFLRVEVQLCCVWRFPSGITTFSFNNAQHQPLLHIGLVNGRVSSINTFTRDVQWGVAVENTEVEFVQQHRFHQVFPKEGPIVPRRQSMRHRASIANNNNNNQHHAAAATTRKVTIMQPPPSLEPKSGASTLLQLPPTSPLPTPSASSSSSAVVSASPMTVSDLSPSPVPSSPPAPSSANFLSLLLQRAPSSVLERVTLRGKPGGTLKTVQNSPPSADEAQQPSKASSIRTSSSLATLMEKGCFRRLELNDVRTTLHVDNPLRNFRPARNPDELLK